MTHRRAEYRAPQSRSWKNRDTFGALSSGWARPRLPAFARDLVWRGSRHLLQEPRQHFIRVEIFLRDLTGGPAMAPVIRVNPADRLENVVARLESEQAGARRQESAEAGFLRDHWTAGGKVTNASIAEPAAARGDITALGNSEFTLGFLNKIPVMSRRVCHARRIEQPPAVLGQGSQIFFFVAMDGHRQQKFLPRQCWQAHELPQRMGLLAVEGASVFHGAVTTPIRDS